MNFAKELFMVALILKFLHQLIQEGRFTVFSVAFIFIKTCQFIPLFDKGFPFRESFRNFM